MWGGGELGVVHARKEQACPRLPPVWLEECGDLYVIARGMCSVGKVGPCLNHETDSGGRWSIVSNRPQHAALWR